MNGCAGQAVGREGALVRREFDRARHSAKTRSKPSPELAATISALAAMHPAWSR